MNRTVLAAFAAGLLFAIGLCISGMTIPAKVIGFLDVGGKWDPALVFVMVGAIGSYGLLRRLILRRPAPLMAPRFQEPTNRTIDSRLVAGSALFGIGWGLAGYCPGPAVVSLAGGALSSLIFVAAMFAGFVLHRSLRT